MRDDEIKKLEEERDYLRKWLANLGSAQDLAPEVQKKLEQIEWAISALKNSPEESEEIPTPYLVVEIDRDYRLLPRALPMMPDYNLSVFSSSAATTTSGSAGVYGYVTRVGDLGTPDAQAYSKTFIGLYHDLEASQKRPNDIRELLTKLDNQQTVDRFEEAYGDFFSYKGGVKDKKAAALSMRNFLDGVQGDLFNKARILPKENMIWETMAKRLAKVTAAGEEDILIEQEEKRSSLISRLSDVLKDREGGSATNLEYIWIQLLDHVYVVLNLIEQ